MQELKGVGHISLKRIDARKAVATLGADKWAKAQGYGVLPFAYTYTGFARKDFAKGALPDGQDGDTILELANTGIGYRASSKRAAEILKQIGLPVAKAGATAAAGEDTLV